MLCLHFISLFDYHALLHVIKSQVFVRFITTYTFSDCFVYLNERYMFDLLLISSIKLLCVSVLEWQAFYFYLFQVLYDAFVLS